MMLYNQSAGACRRPLPPDIAGLPLIPVEPCFQVQPQSTYALNLEGPVFDRDGNFYFCCNSTDPAIGHRLMKRTPDGALSDFFLEGGMRITGLAFHADGRLFGADLKEGSIVMLSPAGDELRRIPIRQPDGGLMAPDDLVFDMNGDLYFTDLRGWPGAPSGGLFRLELASDYTKPVPLLLNMCGPNGISFTPDYSALWIAESGRKTLTRVELDAHRRPDMRGGINIIPMSVGVGIPDSNAVDSEGNVYQGIVKEGRLAVLDRYGIQIANILVPGREKDRHLMPANVIIRPGTDDGYFVAGGEPGMPVGAAVFHFKALAPAQELFSHAAV